MINSMSPVNPQDIHSDNAQKAGQNLLFSEISPEKPAAYNNNSSLRENEEVIKPVQKSDCAGRKWGHDFPIAGAECQKCGVNQDELSGRKLRGMMQMFGEE